MQTLQSHTPKNFPLLDRHSSIGGDAFHGIGPRIAESRLKELEQKNVPRIRTCSEGSIQCNTSSTRSSGKQRSAPEQWLTTAFRKRLAENRAFPSPGRPNRDSCRPKPNTQLGIRFGTRKDKGLELWVPPLQRDNLWLYKISVSTTRLGRCN